MTIRRRKNFLPAFFLGLLSWAGVAFFIFFVDPEVLCNFIIPGSYIPFFLFLFLAVFFTGSLLFGHTRRGLLTAIGVVTYFFLRLFGLGHLLNSLLLIGFLVFFELALSSQK